MDAVADMREAGYEPLDPFPGTVGAPWRSRCLTCGAERRPTLRDVRRGRRCAHRSVPTTTEADAVAELQSAGFEPRRMYPGTAKASWLVHCTQCKVERTVTLNQVRSGERCQHQLAKKGQRAGLRYSKSTLVPVDEAVSRYQAGESLVQIAQAYGTSATTLRRLFDERGLERRPSHWKAKGRKPGQGGLADSLPATEIIRRYREGSSLASLAKAYGVSVKTIQLVMIKNGEPRRSPAPKKGVSKVLDSQMEAEIVRRHRGGESVRDIAASLGITQGPVRAALKRHEGEAGE